MAIITIRVDSELKSEATEVFKRMGLDLSTAIRMFLKKSVDDDGIPFPTKRDRKAYENIRKMQRHAEKIGISDMTLEEINEIIKEVREEKERRQSKK